MIGIINCQVCKKEIEVKNGRKKYCEICKIKVRKESKAKYDKKYRQTEKYKENLKRYYINLEHRGIDRLERVREYRKKRKAYFHSEEGREDYEKHKAKQNKYANSIEGKLRRKRYKQSPQGRDAELRRRKKTHSAKHIFTIKQWEDKLKKTKGICPECKKYVGINKLTFDHIFPVSKSPRGYVYKIGDVQPLCKGCNSKKKDNCIFI